MCNRGVRVNAGVVAFHFKPGFSEIKCPRADLHLHLVSLEGPRAPSAQVNPEKHRL